MMLIPNEYSFIKESNQIEGIRRDPTPEEIEEFHRFMAQDEITVETLQKFVSVHQLGAILRDKVGLDVRVGRYYPPRGCMNIRKELESILKIVNESSGSGFRNAYKTHHAYESLHPFTDGNGRSGRMLWLWQMREAPLGFLHTWYYQSLDGGRK